VQRHPRNPGERSRLAGLSLIEPSCGASALDEREVIASGRPQAPPRLPLEVPSHPPWNRFFPEMRRTSRRRNRFFPEMRRSSPPWTASSPSRTSADLRNPFCTALPPLYFEPRAALPYPARRRAPPRVARDPRRACVHARRGSLPP
jgi:hypothetical protein